MNERERFPVVVDVHLLLVKEGEILLLKRANTGYMDGYYHVPAGHLDRNERLIDALIRESREEIGITVLELNVKLVHVMHNRSNNERMGFFFEVENWSGEIVNLEPEKHSEISWFDLKHLPEKIVPYAKEAINNYHQRILLSHFGW